MEKLEEKEKIELTPTELRGLIFWATIGIERINNGTYQEKAIEFIQKKYKIMIYNKKRYKNIIKGKYCKF